jgi:hypothetical protein
MPAMPPAGEEQFAARQLGKIGLMKWRLHGAEKILAAVHRPRRRCRSIFQHLENRLTIIGRMRQ